MPSVPLPRASRRWTLADRFDVFAGALAYLGVILGVLILPSNLIDRWLLDERFLMRSNGPPADRSLVVVALDQKYGEQYNFPEITPREYLADLITVLAENGARVVALDVIFSERDTLDASFDTLVHAVKSGPRVVLPSLLEAYGLRGRTGPQYELVLEPPDTLTKLTSSGYITFFGGRRPEMKVLTELTDYSFGFRESDTVASFALQAVAAFHGVDDVTVLLDTLGYPAARATDQRRINYFGPVEPGSGIIYASSEDVLRRRGLGPGTFRDKLVLVGVTHRRSEDVHETPWGPMHGVELHANIINSLLTGTYLRPRDDTRTAMLLGLLAVVFVLASLAAYRFVQSFWLASVASAGLLLLYPAALLFAAFWVFDQPEGIVLPLGLPLKIWLATALAGSAIAVSFTEKPPSEPTPNRPATASKPGRAVRRRARHHALLGVIGGLLAGLFWSRTK